MEMHFTEELSLYALSFFLLFVCLFCWVKITVAVKPQKYKEHLLHLEKGFAKYPRECLGIMNGF